MSNIHESDMLDATTYFILAMEHNNNIYKNAAKTLEELNNSGTGRIWIESPDGTTYIIPENSKIKFVEYAFSNK